MASGINERIQDILEQRNPLSLGVRKSDDMLKLVRSELIKFNDNCRSIALRKCLEINFTINVSR